VAQRVKPAATIRRLLHNTALAACVMCGSAATAETLEVRVIDRSGEPVPDVAVFATGPGAESPANQTTEPAIMDQRDTRFVPHILVVQKDTYVSFPNSDVIAHHVYSFSKPNNFVLPLYKGITPEPVRFEHDGIVTLGCNIHDHMLAYIVVVDTDVFGVTDRNGVAELDVDTSTTGYDVSIWSARIRDSKEPVSQHVDAGGNVTFSLQKKLRPRPDHQSEAVEWSEY